MKKPIFKIFAILLTTCFIISSSGNFVVLMILKSRAHQQVWEELEQGGLDDAMVELVIPKQLVENQSGGFSWKDDKKEFRYNGNLYDIISKDLTGDQYHFRCVDDQNEKQIEQLISLELNKILGDQREGSKSSGKIFQVEKKYCNEYSFFRVNNCFLEIGFSMHPIPVTQTIASEIFAPPPNGLTT